MNLLIDEMFPTTIAERLREKHGYDVVAVGERADRSGLPDAGIFLASQQEQRAIVTENVRDFRPLAQEWQAMGRVHFGLVLTTNRRFPRAQSRTHGRLVTALKSLLDADAQSYVASNREIWL